MLNIVATPIGNLKDITLRALETLQNCDAIICEDTRRTGLLLNHYQIKKPLIIMNDFQESSKIDQIIERLKTGQNLSLVSDAGTPLISDPGYKLIRTCIEQGIEIDSLPGPSAIITSLTLSGLAPDKFMFLGYPPDKPGHRQSLYQQIKDLSNITKVTFILFVAPFKLQKTLTEMQLSLGDIEITLAKELTKIFQTVESHLISQWLEKFKKSTPKGEYVMLLKLSS